MSVGWRTKLIPRKIPREDEGKRVHAEGLCASW